MALEIKGGGVNQEATAYPNSAGTRATVEGTVGGISVTPTRPGLKIPWIHEVVVTGPDGRPVSHHKTLARNSRSAYGPRTALAMARHFRHSAVRGEIDKSGSSVITDRTGTVQVMRGRRDESALVQFNPRRVVHGAKPENPRRLPVDVGEDARGFSSPSGYALTKAVAGGKLDVTASKG